MGPKAKLMTRNALAEHLAKTRERDHREAKKTGAISGLEVLQYGKTNNWSKFKESMSTYALREFGEMGKLFESADAEFPDIPDVEDYGDDEYAAEDAGPVGRRGTLQRMYLKACERRERKIEERKSREPALFATIFGQLSEESKDKVRQDANFEEVWENKDPVGLWTIVGLVHQTGGTGIAILDKRDARKAYASLRQSRYESCLEFKTRFVQAIDRLIAVEETIIDDETMAIDFIDRLDEARFSQLKADLYNDQYKGHDTFPKTLVDALILAANYKVTAPRQVSDKVGGGAGATVFIANADNNKGKGKAGGKAKQAKDDAKAKPKEDPPANESKPSTRPGHRIPAREYVPPDGCFLCGGPHMAKFCPLHDEVESDDDDAGPKKPSSKKATPRKRVNVAFAQVDSSDDGVVLMGRKNSTSDKIRDTDILLDTQASVSIFKNANLVKNIRPEEPGCTIHGIGGCIRVDRVADTRYFGQVWYDPRVMANVWSFSEAKEAYDIDYDNKTNVFIVNVNKKVKLKFVNKAGGLYIHDASHLVPRDAVVKVQVAEPPRDPPGEVIQATTVAENEQLFSPRQVKAARAAQELMRRMGFMSSKDEAAMLNAGSILNCPVTAADVYRATRIDGPDVASLKGKTTSKPSKIVKIEYLPRPVPATQTLHVDIMFVEGEPYLISVSTPLLLTMVNHLGGKKTTSVLRAALLKQIAAYRAEAFEVKHVLTDGEGGVHAMTTELNTMGIKVNPAGPGEHVPVIENKIKQVKSRVRAHVNSLPYALCFALLMWLVQFCVSRINMVPSSASSDYVSAFEKFRGRKVDYARDLRVGFGDYVQTHEPNIIKNSMAPRTQGAIALLPLGNLQGSCRFFCLSTKSYVTRDKWTLLPTPQVVIDFMNALDEKSAKKIKKDPVFTYNSLEVSEDDEDNGGDLYVQEPMRLPNEDRADLALEVDEDLQFEVARAEDVHGRDDLVARTRDQARVEVEAEPTHDDPQPVQVNADEHYRGDANEFVDGAEVGPELQPDAEAFEDFPENFPDDLPDDLPADRIDVQARRARAEAAQVRRSNRPHTRSGGHWTHRGWVRDEVGLHITVSKALKKMPRQALREMYRELRQMVDKSVWDPVQRRRLSSKQLRSVIRSSMFLKEKFLPSGDFDKLKARLVAGGDMQDKSIYDDISSPTVSTQAAFMVAGIAAQEGRHVATVDITGAYLNANMGEHEVFMRLDPKMSMILTKIDASYEDFLNDDGTLIVKLNKALYGCIESAKLWYDHLCKSLEDMGFVRNALDFCVFNRLTTCGKQCTVIVHVDDLKITCVEESEVDKVVAGIQAIYKDIK